MQPTSEQQAILDAIRNSRENLMVTTIRIPLTFGLFATIDAEDYDKVIEAAPKWRAVEDKNTYYAQATVWQYKEDGTRYRTDIGMHRVVMNAKKGQQINHADGNGLNNCKSNLEIVTNQQNQERRNFLNKNNSSGIRGVYWNKALGKWHAQIAKKHIGFFEKLEDAAAARKMAEEQKGYK